MPTLTPTGGPAHTPLLVLNYSARRATGTVVHGRVSNDQPSPDITLRTPSLRSGSLTLLFPNAATAQAAFDGLGGKVWVFVHEGRPQWSMSAVSTNDLEIVIQEDAELFIVNVPFQEVSP